VFIKGGEKMKVIIIYDNTSTKSDLQADWGFSALVEIEGRRILFDTGADGDILLVKSPTKLYKGVYSTGELDGIEQSLCVETEKGIVIIAGCSHPKMEHILKAASQFGKVYGIIGGLHGTKPVSLKDLDLICPTHCTQYKSEIKSLYPEKYIEGGVGKVIEI